MDGKKQVLTVREIAARFICKDVERGLKDLDRVINSWHLLVTKKSKLQNRIFITISAAIVFFLLMFVACFGDRMVRGVFQLLIVGLMPAWVLIVLYLRKSQYGELKIKDPQKMRYLNSKDPIVANLEYFFKIAQSETGPRAFYVTRGGRRQEVKRQYFFGNMRLAVLAESPSIKATMWAPWGLWFDRELFMEVDVESLIKQAKAKPRNPESYRTHDFTDVLISLFEHPFIRDLDIGASKNRANLIRLLEARCDEVTPPVDASGGTMGRYADKILAAIAENRSAKA